MCRVQNKEEEGDSIRRTSITIGRAAQQLNERLGTKEGEKDIYKVANLRKRQRLDLDQLSVLKDKDGIYCIRMTTLRRDGESIFNV